MMSRARDTGAAAAEFVMISVLLLLLLFGVVQVGVYFYARNMIEASAADAARYAAAAGVPAGAGGARAQQLIESALGRAQARAVRCTGGVGRDGDSGLPVATVHCVGKVRALVAPVDIPLRIDFTSSALKEQTP
jgi:Flp pilus assembly protein TadG